MRMNDHGIKDNSELNLETPPHGQNKILARIYIIRKRIRSKDQIRR
jgi:hypothetical protein